MTLRLFRIPKMRKANGRTFRSLSKSFVSVLDTWGCHVEPGKYFGRFPHGEIYIHCYGSWAGDSVALHREDARDGAPVAQAFFTPSQAWWTKPLVYGSEAYGLKGLHDSFVKFAKSHPELNNY